MNKIIKSTITAFILFLSIFMFSTKANAYSVTTGLTLNIDITRVTNEYYGNPIKYVVIDEKYSDPQYIFSGDECLGSGTGSSRKGCVKFNVKGSINLGPGNVTPFETKIYKYTNQGNSSNTEKNVDENAMKLIQSYNGVYGGSHENDSRSSESVWKDIDYNNYTSFEKYCGDISSALKKIGNGVTLENFAVDMNAIYIEGEIRGAGTSGSDSFTTPSGKVYDAAFIFSGSTFSNIFVAKMCLDKSFRYEVVSNVYNNSKTSIGGEIATYELNKAYYEKTTLFDSINYMDKSYIKDGINAYACGYVESANFVNTLKLAILGTKPTKDQCKNFFGVSDSADVGVYTVKSTSKVTDSKKSDYSTGIVNCTWKYTASDFNNGKSFNMGFKMAIRYDSGKIQFTETKNIENLYPYLSLTGDELGKILNQDKSILSSFKSGVAVDPPEIVDWGAVAVGLGVGTGIALFGIVKTVITGGAGAITGSTMVGAGITMVGGAIAGGLASYALKTINSKITFSLTGDGYRGQVHFSHGSIVKKINNPYSGVSCTFDSSVKKADDKTGNNNGGTGIDHNFVPTCDNLMSGEFGKIINYITNIMRFVAIALLVVLSAIDFIKPIVSGDADELQKSGSKFVKRLIIAILIFFVPAIVELLLSLIGRTC